MAVSKLILIFTFCSSLYSITVSENSDRFTTYAKQTGDVDEPTREIGFKKEFYRDIPVDSFNDFGFKNSFTNDRSDSSKRRCCKCKEGFVDPHDMLNYVHGAQQMEDSDTVLDDRVCSKDVSSNYLQRFVNLFLRGTGLKDYVHKRGGTKQINLNFEISSRELKVLQDFAEKGDGDLNRLNDALSTVFSTKRDGEIPNLHDDGGGFEFGAHLKTIASAFMRLPQESPGVCIAVCCAAVFFITMRQVMAARSLRLALTSLFFIIFFAGFGWNWHWMVKVEEQKRNTMNHLHANKLPIHCRRDDWTWYQWIVYSYSYEEECQKYFEKMHIDPIAKVSPAIVLSETVSMFVLHPAGHLGTAVGSFVASLLEAVPVMHRFYVVPLVLLFSSVLVFTVVVTWCGVGLRFKLPFSCFEIGRLSPKRHEREYVEDVPSDDAVLRVEERPGGGSVAEIEASTPKTEQQMSPRALKELKALHERFKRIIKKGADDSDSDDNANVNVEGAVKSRRGSSADAKELVPSPSEGRKRCEGCSPGGRGVRAVAAGNDGGGDAGRTPPPVHLHVHLPGCQGGPKAVAAPIE